MSKIVILIVSIVGLLALTTIVIQFQKNIASQKLISSLKSEVNELEEKLKKAQEKNTNLETKLSEVKHFDNDASIGQSFSGGVSYTGEVLKTQIDGDFEGWEGETIFKLTNGTIWQQSSYAYTYYYAYRPEVIIYRKNGTYYMKVEDVDDEIRVTQIK